MRNEVARLTEGGLDRLLSGIESAAVAGHVSPDGDCFGSTCALYAYIKKNFPSVDADLYLEEVPSIFSYLPGIGDAKQEPDRDASYEVLFLLDVSSRDRIGAVPELPAHCDMTVCIDHHLTNKGIGELSHIVPNASSACEVLCDLLVPDKIDKEIASALYTGIIHDSGLFTYSCTSAHTLQIASKLMAYGIPFTEIADSTYMERSYTEAKILGYALDHAELLFDGKCMFSCVTQEVLDRYNAKKRDTDAVVSQLRSTRGVKASVFIYPAQEGYKASLRSVKGVDVSRVAAHFGGGGHRQAAGCTLLMPLEEAKKAVIDELAKELS